MAKIGRPSKYKPEMCQVVIDTMAAGFSREVAAYRCGISKETLYQWIDQDGPYFIPSFSDAVKAGVEACRAFWEQRGMDLTENLATSKEDGGWSRGSAAVFIFNMKNRFREDWRDEKHVEVSPSLILDDAPPPAKKPTAKRKAIAAIAATAVESDDDPEL